MEIPQNKKDNKSLVGNESKKKSIKLYNSPELFGSKNEIMICHKGEIYRVRITRNDKLIMNK